MRKLGTQELAVPAPGLGLMGMSHAYGRPEERDERNRHDPSRGRALAPDRIAGPRYGEKMMAQVDR